MIKVEGYKAFHGTMRIVPKNMNVEPMIINDTDWLYKPDTKCWYGDGRSFAEEICEIVEDENER